MKFKFLVAFLISTFLLTPAMGNRLQLSKEVYANKKLPFKAHAKKGRFGSYLVMDINYLPIQKLTEKVSKEFSKKLKNRGEAHITVVTPVEFFDILKNRITIQEINMLAQKLKIQSSLFTIVCLGRGQAYLNNHLEETFFVVVSSKDILKIRVAVHKLFVKKGGLSSKFDPYKFYPHITLGFTNRDLHLSDGVLKGPSSCARELKIY